MFLKMCFGISGMFHPIYSAFFHHLKNLSSIIQKYVGAGVISCFKFEFLVFS